MQRVHITPYALTYTRWYLGLTVLIAFIFALLAWPGGIGTILIIIFTATAMAARSFVRDHARVPNVIEAQAYSWRALVGAFLASLLITVPIALFVLPAQDTQEILDNFKSLEYVMVGLGVLALLAGAYYAVIRFGFVWSAKQFLQRR